MNFSSYTSYISGNEDKALEIILLHDFRAFSVLCKVFFKWGVASYQTEEHDTHPQPLPKGGEIEAYTSSDRRTKEQRTFRPSASLCEPFAE